MQYVILTVAAYALLAVESTLTDGRGTFAWLLLPWIAVTLKPAPSIVAAFIYGLLLDALSSSHPGVFVAASVLATASLRVLIQESALSSGPRIVITGFACAALMSLLVQSILCWMQSQPIDGELVTITAIQSAIGATLIAAGVTVIRTTLRQRSAKSPV